MAAGEELARGSGWLAAPETLFRRFDQFDVRVIQPWGMTETTPIAPVCTLKPHMESWFEARCAGSTKTGIGVRMESPAQQRLVKLIDGSAPAVRIKAI